jgi:hypothetical protein
VTKPASRWRNWWRAPKPGSLSEGGWVVAGETLFSNALYDSREDAEVAAASTMIDDALKHYDGLNYLGAHPEGERP